MNGGKFILYLIVLVLNLIVVLKQGMRVDYLGELLVFVVFFIASLIILINEYRDRNTLFTPFFFLIAILNVWYIGNSMSNHAAVNAGLFGWLIHGATLLFLSLAFVKAMASLNGRKHENVLVEKEIVPKIKAFENAQRDHEVMSNTDEWPKMADIDLESAKVKPSKKKVTKKKAIAEKASKKTSKSKK